MDNDDLTFTAEDARDEIAAALYSMLAEGEPKREDGWRTVNEIHAVGDGTFSIEALRKRLEHDERVERINWRRKCYYRAKTDDVRA